MTKAARYLAPVAALALAATAACAPSTDDDESGGGDGLTLATGSQGGTYYPLGNAIAGAWSSELDVSVNGQATDASAANLRMLDGGTADIVMAVNGTAVQAHEGTEAFEGDGGLENEFAALGNVYAEVLQIVATVDSGIESIEDLDGRDVAIGPAGSATAIMADNITESYGIELGTAHEDDFQVAADRMSNHEIDASFALLSLPAASLEDVAQSVDVDIVDFPDEGLEELMANDPSLTLRDIPQDTYSGMTDDVTTVTNWATMYVSMEMDEDLAYDLTRVMYENAEDVEHAVADEIQLDTALDGLGGVNLHPGAERFYEEQDVEIPEE